MSLKLKLNSLIQKRGYVPLNEIYAYANEMGYKQKTAERTLNPSLNTEVITVKDKKGQITGYQWKQAEKRSGCCTEMIAFGRHFKPCVNTVQENKQTAGTLF